MAPNIPVPTPVTGAPFPKSQVDTLDGARLLVGELHTKYPESFDLFILALYRFQENGHEDFDKDNEDGTSYFQIAGIHGAPFVNWQKDPTGPQYPGIAAGYCTHTSTLFLPWHRPYLALYEQIICAYATEIVEKELEGAEKSKYTAALAHVRLPYWDWAENAHLPEACLQRQILVFAGSTKLEQLIRNPLFSYSYTSEMAKDLVNTQLITPSLWTESKRCPDADGNQHPEVSDLQNFAEKDQRRTGIFQLMSVDDYGQFSNTAFKPDSEYDSLESHHNTVHNLTGSNQSQPVDQRNPLINGNMEDLWTSSFDPIFWLHHCNIDRIWAIWQAIHPGSTINPEQALIDRWTQAAYITKLDDGTAPLEPFHKSEAHSMEDYWLTDETKEVQSIAGLGYQYKETPLGLMKDPSKLSEFTKTQVNELYGPKNPGGSFRRQPRSNDPSNLEPVRKEWVAFIRVKRFAISGSFFVHVFLGDVPEDPTQWLTANSRVGCMSVFAPHNITSCENCLRQRGRSLDVSGAVYLSDALFRRLGEVQDDATVIHYLAKNLSWRVAKGPLVYPNETVDGLKVGILARDVAYPGGRSLARRQPVRQFPEVTEHKDGGFVRGDTF